MDEIELELDSYEDNAEKNLKVKNRFQQLSEKVILTSKEKDEALTKAQAEAEARLNAEKERDFYKGFSTNVTKYPNAHEYQEQILEKVKGGYDVEDAMVAVLAKEGKLNMTSAPVPQAQVFTEGGSAPTAIGVDKSIKDMSLEEKFSQLEELDKSGQLANLIRG